jgi:hypothetical protein
MNCFVGSLNLNYARFGSFITSFVNHKYNILWIKKLRMIIKIKDVRDKQIVKQYVKKLALSLQTRMSQMPNFMFAE